MCQHSFNKLAERKEHLIHDEKQLNLLKYLATGLATFRKEKGKALP